MARKSGCDGLFGNISGMAGLSLQGMFQHVAAPHSCDAKPGAQPAYAKGGKLGACA